MYSSTTTPAGLQSSREAHIGAILTPYASLLGPVFPRVAQTLPCLLVSSVPLIIRIQRFPSVSTSLFLYFLTRLFCMLLPYLPTFLSSPPSLVISFFSVSVYIFFLAFLYFFGGFFFLSHFASLIFLFFPFSFLFCIFSLLPHFISSLSLSSSLSSMLFPNVILRRWFPKVTAIGYFYIS